ncbi:GntR family transcriptional regulator [Kitasatospora paracochleata]|uniref:GntR family transcriptional regulator n=1 Tax=Kitasatospora paracochleata TaxID=58354 RepID=A0ABT1JBI6_9ACTN|nr:GntR family transcriptional regulator [Kitasatospora paracochleata]MCP2314036.1 GntR family transcriptional regulator [Kitasatospora paracochleata]
MTPTDQVRRGSARSVADALREQIRSGELGPGAALPTGRELAERFQVTAKTAAAGVDILKAEGLVIGEQGGRRRVRAVRRITWNLSEFERGSRRDSHALDDWATAIKEAGREPGESIVATLESADAQVAACLRLAEGDEVVKRARVRWVDDEPFQLSTSCFPGTIAKGTVLEESRELSFPGGVLRYIGYPQTRIRDEISTRMPTPEETELLQLPLGTPVIQHVRVGHGTDFPVRVMITIAPGDRNLLVYEQEV